MQIRTELYQTRAVFIEGHSAGLTQGLFIIDEYNFVCKTTKHVLCRDCTLKDILGRFFSQICFHVGAPDT